MKTKTFTYSRSIHRLVLAVACVGTLSPLAVAAEPVPSATQTAAVRTPAQYRITAAGAEFAKAPKRAEPYVSLAAAYVARARETGDSSHLDSAEKALAMAQRTNPKDFAASKVSIAILQARHKYQAAREAAERLNKAVPDDVGVYGQVADACIALGDYDAAEKATQWMLDLRPGNADGLIHAAMLRELFGDLDGAIDFMKIACQACSPAEVEEQAWRLARCAHLELQLRRLSDAETDARLALEAFPDSFDGLAVLAEILTAQGKDLAAVEPLRKRAAVAARPAHLFDLAVALQRVGNTQEAGTLFARFEKAAIAQIDQPDNANLQLVFYYTDYAKRPSDALRVAKAQVAHRHDFATLEALAWAFHAAVDDKTAAQTMKAALVVGYRDATLFYHAGVIALATKDVKSADLYWKSALDLYPTQSVSLADWKQMRRAHRDAEAPADR